jgi:ATP-dependent DNA helicase Rep
VDEYQDTNLCQYELVKLLAGSRGMLTVVGDDDQSIYTWRGAHPENLKQLQQDFPALKVVKLEQNYRSTGRILKAANALIANNPHIFEKSLWCDRDYGESLRVLRARGDEHEAERVVSELLYHKFKHNTDFRDYAILFRENNQSRVLERVLRERRIPYFLSGGTSFFDKTEIKDVMAYLRLMCNPGDDNAFLRVINTPRREIGPATLELLAAHAAEIGTSLLQASMDPGIDTKLTARQETTLRSFTHWLMEMITKSEDEEPAKLVCDMLADLHYEDWLKDTCNDHKIAQRRMENVLELVGWIQRLARQEEDMTLSDLVARLTLSGILDRGDQENPGDLVSLMTVHAAKGLEFQHVFIVGMEEGLLPHHQSQSDAGVEEERRLAYVAMTRARQTLTFSFVDRRKRGGEVISCEPSRFLKEMPADDLKWEEPDREPDPQAMLGRADVYLANLRNMLGNS